MKKIYLLLILPVWLWADLNTTLEQTDKISHDLRKTVTKKYHRFLNSIDSMFCKTDDINRTSYKKIRKSRMQVIISLKDNTQFKLHLRGNIVLPQLKNKAEITFSQDDKQEIDNQNSIASHDDVINDKKLHVGLKYYLYREKRSAAYAKLNLKISPPFGPYLKLGMDKGYLSNNFFETTFNNAFYYYLNGGKTSASTAVSFFKPFNNFYWFGQGNKLYWKGTQSLYLNNSLLFYQIFDLYNRMIYKIAVTNSYEKGKHFAHESFEISSGYFHRFDKWFFVEAIPKFRKSRTNDYKNEYLISINFGVLLGN